MIPHKLYIKNFLSYGPETQTIEFFPHKLICLSGKNGHGKSALLDAITWALWGVARKTLTSVKPDEGLLHLGQTQMFVMLDFELNGVMYRVRREFLNTYGKPYANLDFGLYDTATDKFSPLTDKTIRKTQEKIEQILRLSYDSFVNSAFLRQGHSNEFSKKSPKERKEILASILGLDQYETLRKLAADKVKHAQTELATLQAFQEKLIGEMSKKEGILAAIIELEKKLLAVTEQEKKMGAESTEITQQEKKLHELQKQYELLQFEYEKISQSETAQLQKLREYVSTWRTTHKKLIALPDQQTIDAQKKELMRANQEHQQKLQRTLELKEQYLLVKEKGQQIADVVQKAHLKTEQDALLLLERIRIEQIAQEKKVKELFIKKETIDREQKELGKTEVEYQAKIKAAASLQSAFENQTAQFEKRKAAYQKFITQANQLKTELNNIASKDALVHNDKDPSCPLCEQNLSASRRKFLKTKFTKDQQFREHQLKRLSRVIAQLKILLLEQHGELEKLKKEGEALHTVQIKLEEIQITSTKLQLELNELSKQLITEEKRAEENKQALAKQEQTCKDLEVVRRTILDTHQEYQINFKELESIVKEGKAIAYNQKQHQEVQTAIQALDTQIASYAALQAESIAQDERKKQIGGLIAELRVKRREKTQLLEKMAAFKNNAQQEQELVSKRVELAHRTKEALTQKELLLQEQGRLQEQEKKLIQYEAEHKEQQKAIAQLQHTIFDYQIIATATGKDGVQALLIEEAIPEIEHEANYLLSRLTNNQAQIFIESLRDLKKGGTKETLDIKISDPAGIRPYEMFSGGEAFRIDFALRIAVSKLLARRAGTALQTLIIDEGFGSQDDEGLSNIMDCIHKIQDDFSLIIIVSHLSTMKDQFPVHFVVEKRAQASRINVIELG